MDKKKVDENGIRFPLNSKERRFFFNLIMNVFVLNKYTSTIFITYPVLCTTVPFTLSNDLQCSVVPFYGSCFRKKGKDIA